MSHELYTAAEAGDESVEKHCFALSGEKLLSVISSSSMDGVAKPTAAASVSACKL